MDPATAPTAERRRGRRRSPATHRAILEATLALLEESGYGATTIEGVAARAGVGKQTIYRWWPSRAALVMEAYEGRVLTRTLEPDTGSVREDVCRSLLHIANVFATTSAAGIVTSLAAEAHQDDELRVAFLRFMENRRAVMRRVLQRAQRRGQLRAGTDLELVIDTLYGPVLFRALMSGGTLSVSDVEHLADMVLEEPRPSVNRSRFPR
jgi:AcrR family transcriptional regulator